MQQSIKLLVVDDERINRRVLSELLESEYEIVLAKNGLQAIQRLETDPEIQLLLLDVLMPEMDGYETLRRIKTGDRSDIPVIFISALDSDEDEEKGLALGAVDYITKPFKPALVKLRVRHQVELSQYHKDLKNLVELRTRELIQSEKMASLGVLAAGIAHEINNPLGFILNNVEVLKEYTDILSPTVKSIRALVAENKCQDLDEDTKSVLLGDEIAYLLDDIEGLEVDIVDGIKRISEIVMGLKSFARADKGLVESFNINDCLKDALSLSWHEIKYKARVEEDLADVPDTKGNPVRMTQVLVNLLVNAAQAVAEDGLIRIRSWSEDNQVNLSIKDNGTGIEREHMHHLFEPFYTTKPEGKGTGLGLSISHGIVEDHGGAIGVTSEPGQGAEFVISLPLHV